MKHPVKLKVCGLKFKHNLYATIETGVDYVGMIFYEKSPRYMVDSIYPEDIWFLPDEVEKIGVFVNADIGFIQRYAKLYQLDLIQLHGSETPEFCASVRELGYSVIKVFGVGEEFDFAQLQPYLNQVDFFLFDTQTPVHGGSGKTFPWHILRDYPYDTPVFVGGGIGTDNLEILLDYNFPFLHALDMNSMLEEEPGIKDINLVRTAADLVATYNKR